MSAAVSAEHQAVAREECEALHDEVERLPSIFRLPIVLCYFEGLTLDEAAQNLRWPAGTVRSRLARARDKLRSRLVRRGIALPDGAMAAILSSNAASTGGLVALVRNHHECRHPLGGRGVSRVVGHGAGARRAPIHVAAQAEARGFRLARPRAAWRGAWPVHWRFRTDRRLRPSQFRAPGTRRSLTPTAPAPGRMHVTGRVLDPQGRPVPGAAVMVYAQLKQFDSPSLV